MTDLLLRHIAACNNAELPGDRLRFRIGPHPVGWVGPAFAALLLAMPEFAAAPNAVVLLPDAAPDLPEIARRLSERGIYRNRHEAFDVRATPAGPVLARIDRGALPSFGILAQGVHLNGLVQKTPTGTTTGLHLWVARRAATKALDPGKLDHLVAGGVPANRTLRQTLVKEAAEEAGIPPDLAAQATETGRFTYAMTRPEGLRRDHIVAYDLTLPDSFAPIPADGEVESFALWPIETVLAEVRTTDNFKFNVNLVLIDLFLRLDLVPEAAELRLALHARRDGDGLFG